MVITEYLYDVQSLLFQSKNNVIGRNNHIWIITEKNNYMPVSQRPKPLYDLDYK